MNLPNRSHTLFGLRGGVFSSKTPIPDRMGCDPDAAGSFFRPAGWIPNGAGWEVRQKVLIPDAAGSIPDEMGWLPGRKGIRPAPKGMEPAARGMDPAPQTNEPAACGMNPAASGIEPEPRGIGAFHGSAGAPARITEPAPQKAVREIDNPFR